jgi:ABC-2 type transport system permease protein
MRYFSYLLPPAYVFEGMRSILSGDRIQIGGLLWGAGLAVVYVLLACWFFGRMYRHAVRTGLIGRYSAESLS